MDMPKKEYTAKEEIGIIFDKNMGGGCMHAFVCAQRSPLSKNCETQCHKETHKNIFITVQFSSLKIILLMC